MKAGILCQSCGVEAPTKYVEFYQNIGALVMRFHKSIKGNLCKKCIHKHFWPMTGATVAIGWLGMISLIVAPIFVLNNIIRYLTALGMPPVPGDARIPQIDEPTLGRFVPKAEECFQRLKKGEDLSDMARAISAQLHMTPGQVIMCMQALAKHERLQAQNNRPTGGFPVIPLDPATRIMPVVTTMQSTPPPLPDVASATPPPGQLGLGS